MTAEHSNADLQREYYARTALKYDAMHGQSDPEHSMALAFMLGAIDALGVRSVLDVGSGTGRVLRALAEHSPHVHGVGVEPVAELRRVGHSAGVPVECLIPGDALALPFDDDEFDLVCAYAVLHHVPRPAAAVAEMLRVARKAVFISDANNFGQGRLLVRSAKQTLHALGLWGVANWVKTRGKGYMVSGNDGLFYPYSLFSDYAQIRAHCKRVHLLDTGGHAINLFRQAGHVALLGILE